MAVIVEYSSSQQEELGGNFCMHEDIENHSVQVVHNLFHWIKMLAMKKYTCANEDLRFAKSLCSLL